MTLEALKQAARLQGYIVFEYSKAQAPLIALNLFDMTKNAEGITNSAEGNNVIFINDSLSEDKQVFVLAHEIGHIALNHQKVNTEAEQKRQEIEADQFAMAVTGIEPFLER